MGLKTTENKTTNTSPWPIAIALAIALLVIQGLVMTIRASTRPQTISLQDYNDLQTNLTSELKAKDISLAEVTRKLQTLETQSKRLERDNTLLKQGAMRLLPPEQLPAQVRGATASQSLNKIQSLCDAVQQVNQDNVSALLAVLVEIQKNSVINAGLDAKDADRQTLYRQIQTILNQIDAYPGPIRSDKTSTLTAVKDYQTQNSLKVDGKIGINTFMTMVEAFQAKRLGQGPTPSN